MHRTSVMLAEDVLLRLRHESQRQGTSVAEVVRQAIEHHLPAPDGGTPLAFFAIGDGAPPDASEHVDEYVGDVVRRRAGRRA